MIIGMGNIKQKNFSYYNVKFRIPIIKMPLKILIALLDHCDANNKGNRYCPCAWVNRRRGHDIAKKQNNKKIYVGNPPKLFFQI